MKSNQTHGTLRSKRRWTAFALGASAAVTVAVGCAQSEEAAYSAPYQTESLERHCGNGRIDPGEMCDGNDLAGETCRSVTMNASPGGDLRCDAACVFDTSRCRDGQNGGGGGTTGEGGTTGRGGTSGGGMNGLGGTSG